ncbi:MAG: hypothetical protein FWE06_08210 [Oscillospiraceae bacterium]|nr:hypothetical protein [Oscillospiraceae bacterium]
MSRHQVEVTPKHMALALVKGGLFGLAATLAIVLAASPLLAMGLLPQSFVSGLAMIACAVGGASAALFATRKLEGYTLWIAAASGIAVFVLLYLLGATLFVRIRPSANSVPIFLAALGGAIGGAVLRNMQGRKRVNR